jgi:hypothetical protein
MRIKITPTQESELANLVNNFCAERDVFWDGTEEIRFIDMTTEVLQRRLLCYAEKVMPFVSLFARAILTDVPAEKFADMMRQVHKSGRCQFMECPQHGTLMFWRFHRADSLTVPAGTLGYWPCEHWNPGRDRRAARFLADMLEDFCAQPGIFVTRGRLQDFIRVSSAELHWSLKTLFGPDMDMFSPSYFNRILEFMRAKGNPRISQIVVGDSWDIHRVPKK